MRKTLSATAIVAAAMLCAAGSHAQPAPRPEPAAVAPNYAYGAPITLEQVKLVIAAAEAEAARRNAHPSIAIVEPSGELVYFQKATNASYNALEFATRKARAAARLKRPTKFDMDRLAAGNATIQFLPDAFPFAGGYPILWQGKIIGAIGVTAGADEEVALAGVAALK